MEEKKVSLLERSLSLKRNGGIYYGNARVNADDKTAVLFVGLGGSGADVLIRIKDQVKNRMHLPCDRSGAPVSDTPDNIGFLEIDTDAKVEKLSYGTAHFNSDKNEFCKIAQDGLSTVIAQVKADKKTGEECWQWFDDDVTQIDGADGAGGIRQIGRLLLLKNIDKVLNAVDSKIVSLTKDKPQIQKLMVYVFSGISGGTGAGTFLDMAYILRKRALAHYPNVNMMGYLIMTDVNEMNGGDTDALRTNGFSCLKELDYWMNAGQHEERYYQKLPNGTELNELARPFDFCHILDASDAGGHKFSYDKILRSVAENVFAYIAGEVSTDANATSTMAQLYNNIQGYIRGLTGTAKYPGCYNYLSLGASKIEIPYTEISTLIAARVFRTLSNGMFRNRPTEEEFNRTVYRDLEMTEDNIRSALYRNISIPRPGLSEKNYKYGDVWPNNAPYQAAHNWLALFQRAVVQQAGNLPSYLEGRLKEFIKNNLKDKRTGPVYLRYYVNSSENFCLYKMLSGFREYCLGLRAQCAGKSKELTDNMHQAYAEGQNLGFGGSKKRALSNYLNAVDLWYTNEEHAFLNEKIADIIEEVQKRLKLYYENILRPLTDILEELSGIFDENAEYIRANEGVSEDGIDILIRPLEFERTRKAAFEKAVAQAEDNFLNSLSANIRKWIGRDIDDVDENIASSIDVAGFISSFITDNFSALLTINMQDIMDAKRDVAGGQDLADYIKESVKKLLDSSFPMYKESPNLAGRIGQFAMISVPNDCQTIYNVTKQYIEARGLDQLIQVKKSEEKSRMYIIKITSGYPLYSNAFMEELETAYEKTMGNPNASSGKHLKPEWKDRLASPYNELAWMAPYSCKRTRERNEKYREYFDRAFQNGIIVKGEDHWELKCANREIAAQVSRESLSAPTLLGKLEQFEKIKAKLWNSTRTEKLFKCSSYLDGQPDGERLNVRENILRFPLKLEALESECKLSDEIEKIEEELHYPRYFALANINKMIYTNDITGDTVYRRIATDPFPVKLTKGQEMHPDFREYQIYNSFCQALTKEMKEEINLQYENLKERIVINKDALEEYVAVIRKRMQSYEKQTEKARNEMYLAGKEERPSYLKKIEFYQHSVEELKRMLPTGEETEAEPQMPPTGLTGAEAPKPPTGATGAGPQMPRYLDPQTWQPVMNPQPGQQVFDTEQKQIIFYQPEAPKPPRYLDPQTWQPVMNPQPGQQIFDTEQKQMIFYQPEAPAAPRYLNPQTWQPVMNPHPGQQVFDTVIKQMIIWQPGF